MGDVKGEASKAWGKARLVWVICAMALSMQIAFAQEAQTPAPYDGNAITRLLEIGPSAPEDATPLQEQTVTLLEITIALDGSVKAASVKHSSGSQQLDDAAIQFVKDHWKWKPPASNGVSAEAKVLARVSWRQKQPNSGAAPVPAQILTPASK